MQKIQLTLNHKQIIREIKDDLMLLDFLRAQGCYSVRCGCETSNCGLCTVLVDDQPVLSCSTLAIRADNKRILTIEGLQNETAKIGSLLAAEGADQCGFCSPGLIISIYAMSRELKNPSDAEINAYLSGNLCRCSGYAGQLRAIKNYLLQSERGCHYEMG